MPFTYNESADAGKPWYLSKAVWGIILAIILYIANTVFDVVPGDVPEVIVEIVNILLMVLGLYGRWVAKEEIK